LWHVVAVLVPRFWSIVVAIEPEVGRTLNLLVAGLVIFLLLVVSYSQRSIWITLGSTTLSIVLLASCVFLASSSQIRDGLSGLAKEVPSGWDQAALALAASIERASASLASAKISIASREPVLAAVSHRLGSSPRTQVEPKPEPAQNSPDFPIKWFFDELPRAASETFGVSGANISAQPLEEVRAVLKPDSGAGQLVLSLDVKGRHSKDAVVIPPRAQFSLTAPTLTQDEATHLGGAILSFAYLHAGRHKTSIIYLTPPMLMQLTARD
jgi:hypothetical protein